MSGEVTNLAGDRSRQQDIIIFDELAGAPFVRAQQHAIIPVELVSATIQVKIALSPAEVQSAVENVSSVKRLMPGGWRHAPRVPGPGPINVADMTAMKPGGAILVFEGPRDLDAMADAFLVANREIHESADRCDALVILDSAVLVAVGMPSEDQTQSTWSQNVERSLVARINAGPDAVAVFYYWLSTHLSEYRPPAYDAGIYGRALLDYPTQILARADS